MTNYGPLVRWSVLLGLMITGVQLAWAFLTLKNGFQEVAWDFHKWLAVLGFSLWFGVPLGAFVLTGHRPFSMRKKK